MRARRLTWVLLAAVVAGCGDGTSPSGDGRFAVRLLGVRDPEIVDAPGGVASFQCKVDLEATYHGDQPAEWLAAPIVRYIGVDRTVPHDTGAISYETVQSAWGSTHLTPGETRRATFTISAAAPFRAQVTYQARPFNQAVVTDTVSFNCGPIPAPATTGPTLTIVSSTPVTSIIVQPGQTIQIVYRAAAAAGLWQTSAIVTGACPLRQDFSEHFATSVGRALTVTIPLTCAAGPIQLELRASDIALREASQSSIYNVADRTRPVVSAYPLSNIYFVGDSVSLYAAASDNISLAWLLWRVAPDSAVDSLPLSGQSWNATVSVGIASGTALQSRVWVRDGAGLVSDTIRPSLPVYPQLELPVNTTTIPAFLWTVVIDVPRERLYALTGAFPTRRLILTLSRRTLAVLDSVSLPGTGADLDLTASGDSLIVTIPGARAIGVVDLNAPTLGLSVIPLAGLDTSAFEIPTSVRTASNGTVLVAIETNQQTGRVVEVELATGATLTRTDAGNAGAFRGKLARSSDHSTILLSSVGWAIPGALQLYDAASDVFGPTKVEGQSGTASLDASGTRVAVGPDIYDATLTFERRVEAPLNSWQTSLASDGALLYLAGPLPPGRVIRSSATTGQLIDGISVPFVPSEVRASSDGTFLVVWRSSFDTVSRLAVIELP